MASTDEPEYEEPEPQYETDYMSAYQERVEWKQSHYPRVLGVSGLVRWSWLRLVSV